MFICSVIIYWSSLYTIFIYDIFLAQVKANNTIAVNVVVEREVEADLAVVTLSVTLNKHDISKLGETCSV